MLNDSKSNEAGEDREHYVVKELKTFHGSAVPFLLHTLRWLLWGAFLAPG